MRVTSPEEAQKQGREARFRIRVVAAYGYTCGPKKGDRHRCLTGLRVLRTTEPVPFFGAADAL